MRLNTSHIKTKGLFLGSLVLLCMIVGCQPAVAQDYFAQEDSIDFGALPLLNDVAFTRQSKNHKAISSQTPTQVVLEEPIIGNQGRQGSCVAWAVSYAASICEFGTYENWYEAQRSPAFVFNKYKITHQDSTNSFNCFTGIPAEDLNSCLTEDGICSLSNMPYDTTSCTIRPTIFQTFEASLHCYTLSRVSDSLVRDTNFYKTSLDSGRAIVVAQHVTEDFLNMWKYSGSWTRDNIQYTTTYHAGCIYGYDNNRRRFKVLNSWGQSGGENGHYWVSYDLVAAGCYYAAAVVEPLDTTADKYAIYGPDTICDAAAFRLTSVPPTASVTWSVTGLAGSNISVSGMRDSCIVSRENNSVMAPLRTDEQTIHSGAHYLKVTIINGTDTTIVQKEIVLGSIADPVISPSASMPLMARANKTFTVANARSGNLIKWTCNIGTGASQTFWGNPLTIVSCSAGTLNITVENFSNCEGHQTTKAIYTLVNRLPGLSISSITDSSIALSLDADDTEDLSGCSIQILSESMHEVYSTPCSTANISIPRSNIKRGIYIVRLLQDEQTVDTKPLIVL